MSLPAASSILLSIHRLFRENAKSGKNEIYGQSELTVAILRVVTAAMGGKAGQGAKQEMALQLLRPEGYTRWLAVKTLKQEF